MKNLDDSIDTSAKLEVEEHIDTIDSIIQIKREQDSLGTTEVITNEDREIILKRALSTYKLLNETSIRRNGKVLIEYRQGLHKIVEEVIL